MTEAVFLSKVLKELRRRLKSAVIFKHSDRTTRGIPDVSVTHDDCTTWLEAKVVRGSGPIKVDPYQEEVIKRLSQQGRALYVVGLYENRQWLLATVHPSQRSISHFEGFEDGIENLIGLLRIK